MASKHHENAILSAFMAYSLVGCSGETIVSDKDLIKVASYPEVINAQSAVGVLSHTSGCVIFTRQDGTRFVPLFPRQASLKSLEGQVGSLNSPQRVTVSGMTVLDNPSKDVTAVLNHRQCNELPFYFGFFQIGMIYPVAPN